MQAQGLADVRVFDVLDPLDPFDVRILEEVVVSEGAIDGDIDVSVYGCRKHQPSEFLVVRREVSASSSQGDSQW